MAEGYISRQLSMGYITNLNVPFDRPDGLYLDNYTYEATNKPNTLPNDGWVITLNTRNGASNQQVAFDLQGTIGRRYQYQGTISAWKIVTPV